MYFYKAICNVASEKRFNLSVLERASYLVPVETRQERKVFLALNWIVQSAQARSNKQFKTFSKNSAAELLDAYKNEEKQSARDSKLRSCAAATKALHTSIGKKCQLKSVTINLNLL